MRVPVDGGEEARARLLELAPAGFEEAVADGVLELAAYADEAAEAAVRAAFADVESQPVAPGWEDAWKRFHRPVRVGPLWVGPPWVGADPGTTAVVVDPGRAFGTGAHPTTRLCLELLLALDRGSLLDVGCGSGVLAVAAAKLGFRPVTALDEDPAAVDATARNARANAAAVAVRRADAFRDALPEADVVLANIARAAVERIALRVRARVLVTAGYLARERPAAPGWAHRERREAEGWAADRFERA